MGQSFSLRKAGSIFGSIGGRFDASETRKSFPSGSKVGSYFDVTELGREVGFLRRPEEPLAISIFVTKGGVLKTTLTLNLARMAALHGIRVCVVGLDMQGDITQALGCAGPDEDQSLEDALKTLNSLKGLADFSQGQTSLDSIICPTEIPTLFYIPETPDLVGLDQSLLSRNRREYWLKENVIDHLKESFDLILMDCSPNWNRLINNALVASDAVISPIESKINNFRNLKTFRALMAEFGRDMRLEFKHLFVPTRLVSSRRLSREIYEWYRANLETCTAYSIREGVQGEEATALRLSIPEHSPGCAAAAEIRLLLSEIASTLGFAAPEAEQRLILDHAKLTGTPDRATELSIEV